MPVSTSLPQAGALLMRDAFVAYRETFVAITRRARSHFERRDWEQRQQDSQARLLLYRSVVDDTEQRIRALLGDQATNRAVWVDLKGAYRTRIARRPDRELAETFLNSITRRIFATVGVDPLVEFVDLEGLRRVGPSPMVVWDTAGGTAEALAAAFEDLAFQSSWVDLFGDAERVAETIDQARLGRKPWRHGTVIELLEPVFYRGKGAYLVGRVPDPEAELPLAIALHNGPEGLTVDAVLLGEDDVSMLFGFTRTYFQVDTRNPGGLVGLLHELLPRKGLGELYISLGEPKHGKTELYRSLLDHLVTTRDTFELAAGIPGLVMVVFGLPGHDHVFKVIRDRFPPEKEVSPARVRERYRWVYTHDRAGRLVDAQSFEHLAFPRDRFTEAVLDELLAECAGSVEVVGDTVVLKLAYVERRVQPLDLYVRQASSEAARAAVLDYGHALRDLASCNIFPGDLLLKNFGVTRHGRVVFYDYDELVELGGIHFRDFPEAETWEQEMSAEPWFSVGPNDVFPEEFPRFVALPPPLMAELRRVHGELFTASWWAGIQGRLAEGWIAEFPPYGEERRLQR